MYDTTNIKKPDRKLAVPPKQFRFWFDTRYDFCPGFFVLIDRKMLVYIVRLLHNLHSQMLSLNMQFLEECFRAVRFSDCQ